LFQEPLKLIKLNFEILIWYHLKVLEGLDDVGLDALGSGLGLEDAGLLGEGVDALALLGGSLLLDDKSGHAGDDKLSALGELGAADLGDSLEDATGLLAGESGLDHEVVQELTLGEVLALGLHGLQGGLDLRGGLLGGHGADWDF